MNLSRPLIIFPNLLQWTAVPNEGYENLDKMYKQLTGQLTRYMFHVTRTIAGQYYTPKAIEEEGFVYEPVPKLIKLRR